MILEGLIEAVAEYQDFASVIEFELPYFLFDKLRKRAAIYPPVVYSYSQTYGDKLIAENLASSIQGFRQAAETLCKEGLITLNDDRVCLLYRNKKDQSNAEFRGGIGAKLGAAASYTTKSIRQYAVHGYAGRVNPLVVGKEVASKLIKAENYKIEQAARGDSFPKVLLETPRRQVVRKERGLDE